MSLTLYSHLNFHFGNQEMTANHDMELKLLQHEEERVGGRKRVCV